MDPSSKFDVSRSGMRFTRVGIDAGDSWCSIFWSVLVSSVWPLAAVGEYIGDCDKLLSCDAGVCGSVDFFRRFGALRGTVMAV